MKVTNDSIRENLAALKKCKEADLQGLRTTYGILQTRRPALAAKVQADIQATEAELAEVNNSIKQSGQELSFVQEARQREQAKTGGK